MRGLSVLLMVGATAAWIGCADDGGPAGIDGPPLLDFTIQAPAEIETKSAIDIQVTITRARGVEFPLEVQLEKANRGEAFLLEGMRQLDGGDRVVSFRAVPRRDPDFRVTVTESSALALSVQRTFSVEVLDFP
ncbi:MAG TPA: hypothetical protein VFG78_05745 [Gemmatimonadota bacterium]|nr:hypothetical protein [Gemmatimonadota bacterium]